MSTQAGQSTSADRGWLNRMRGLPMGLIMTSAKIAGRAVRFGQDGAFAMAKGVEQAATWSKEQVADSTKLLNPFGWRKGQGKPKAVIAPQAGKPRIGSPTPVKTAPPKFVEHIAPASPPFSSIEPGPEPKTRRVKPPQAKPVSATSGPIPPEVTAAEVSAAVFDGATEKVTFTQAIRDFDNQDSATRARAAVSLGSISNGLSVKVLAARLARDSSVAVRKECVNALAALERSEGLPAIERAMFDSSSTVRLAAVRGVYRLAGTAGASLLVRALSDDNEGVRRRAAACIGWLGCTELAADLIPLLRNENAWVRMAALEALENLKSPLAVDHMIRLLEDPDEPIRKKAFDALQVITGKQMGDTFPKDHKERQFMVARWRTWREESRRYS